MSQTVTPLLEHRLDDRLDDPLARAEDAAADMLRALGLPIDSEEMADTPRRLVRAYAELLTSEPFEMTTFPNTEAYDELVLVRDIPVRSVCEHHLLPFVGVAHVGYLPAGRIVGLSKLARTVDHFARRVQTQERLTSQVADHLQERLDAKGVGVVIEAEHTCMSVRGARAGGARTVTARLLGRLREDPATRAEFLALTRQLGWPVVSGRVVVVGGGLAAGTFVTELREGGHDGPITLFTDEAHPPYERPPLSKDLLLGKAEADDALVHEAGWYADHDVDLRLGTRVGSIDLTARTVHAGGAATGYDHLLLATGSRPRRLAMADDSGVPVAYLRTLEDSLRLKELLTKGARIGIIGGGWIGLEVAAAARNADAEVTILESLDQPLLRVLGPEVAAIFAALHREHGVDLRTSVHVTGIEKSGDGALVSLAEGNPVRCDLLVVGVGVEPVVEPAGAAGLTIDNGIRTDAHLRTSDPHVYAAGDVANADHPRLGRPVRVEHWDTAIQHGKVAAANVLGNDTVADALPYFFTDQYDLGMEYVGSPGPDGFDRVVLRGDTDGREFTAWWLRGGDVVAGMHVNDWDAIDDVRRIVGTRVDPDRLADPGVSLADL